jgi:hypothetical protein
MKKIMMFFAISVVMAGFCILSAQVNKYAVKSGIVTFDVIQKMGKFELKSKVVVYFDDFGNKECRDTYEDDQIKDTYFSDGKDLYTVVYREKTAYKRGSAYRGTEMKFDWNEVSPRDKQSGKAKQIGKITVAGKSCDAFEVTGVGTATKYAGWNNILLYMKLTSKSLTSITNAVKYEENVKVPAEKFKAPAGFAVK